MHAFLVSLSPCKHECYLVQWESAVVPWLAPCQKPSLLDYCVNNWWPNFFIKFTVAGIGQVPSQDVASFVCYAYVHNLESCGSWRTNCWVSVARELCFSAAWQLDSDLLTNFLIRTLKHCVFGAQHLFFVLDLWMGWIGYMELTVGIGCKGWIRWTGWTRWSRWILCVWWMGLKRWM
jgi:hypothetical protein